MKCAGHIPVSRQAKVGARHSGWHEAKKLVAGQVEEVPEEQKVPE